MEGKGFCELKVEKDDINSNIRDKTAAVNSVKSHFFSAPITAFGAYEITKARILRTGLG